MNERIQKLLDTAQRTACGVTAAAADAACGAGERASRAWSAAKTRRHLQKIQAEIDGQLKTIGTLMYATHTGTPTDSETLLAHLQEIDRLRLRRRELETELARREPARMDSARRA